MELTSPSGSARLILYPAERRHSKSACPLRPESMARGMVVPQRSTNTPVANSGIRRGLGGDRGFGGTWGD